MLRWGERRQTCWWSHVLIARAPEEAINAMQASHFMSELATLECWLGVEAS